MAVYGPGDTGGGIEGGGHEQQNGHLGSIYKDVTDFTQIKDLDVWFSPLQTGTAHVQEVYRGYYS
jgi:hypothetical protein